MAGMGPPPKPGAARRRGASSATRLPATGRTGECPKWPLLDDITTVARQEQAARQADDAELALCEPDLTARKRAALQKKADTARAAATILTKQLEAQQRVEGELWAELWATPQAVAWETLGYHREVAQYVRWKVQAEMGSMDASKEARQLADRLGLTPLALLRLRWEIVDEEAQESRPRRRPAAPAGQRPPDDPRAMLHAV